MNNNIQLLIKSPLVTLIKHVMRCLIYVAVSLAFLAAACQLHDM